MSGWAAFRVSEMLFEEFCADIAEFSLTGSENCAGFAGKYVENYRTAQSALHCKL